MQKITTTSELLAHVSDDPAFAEAVRTDPVRAISSVVGAPLPDTWIYRIVVLSLGLTVLVAAIGAIVLAFAEGVTDTPEILVALGSAAVGALAGLLAPSPQNA